MDTSKLIKSAVGIGIGLAVLYLTVRVISSGWKAGQ